jgi:hypothetical protein
MMRRLSDWYDSLPEPKRFFIFMLILFGWWIPFAVVSYMDSVNYTGIYRLVAIIVGGLDILFIEVFALYRAFWMLRK